MKQAIRLAVRAVILHDDKLLLVNAYPDGRSNLWCAPGGGVEKGASLTDNLHREIHEETGLSISVGLPCLVNEFHSPEAGFHQVEVFFRCQLLRGALSDDWKDPEGVVSRRRWVSRDEIDDFRLKPDSLSKIAWSNEIVYDQLEVIVT